MLSVPPVLYARACSRCHGKPCRGLATASAVVVSPRDIPRDCPLIVDRHRRLPPGLDLHRIAAQTLTRAAGRTLPHGLPSHFTPSRSGPEALHEAGLIAVLTLPRRGFVPVGSAASPARAARQEAADIAPMQPLFEEKDSAPPPRRTQSKTKELRFDLAIDPPNPGLRDDVFVLTGMDGSYTQVKTVKDDKVPGDNKLTLVFTGVSEGKAYSLSQIHGDGETLLVPEATPSSQSTAPSTPGEVVGCKVTFRECRIKGEKEDFYQEKESDYLFDLAPASGKWVYVFGGPQGQPYRLLAEGVGLSDGSFRPVDLGKLAGKPQREPLKNPCAWMTLPLVVNGKAWDLYACLSPIQLPWRRVVQLAANPKSRCYRIGAEEGGIIWAPSDIGRQVPDLLNIRDPRVQDPPKDALLVGLIDAMAEARRRADIYQKHVVPYLESRFDLPQADGRPVPAADRRRKYVAGLLKVLVEQHPDKARLRAALADHGNALDTYLIEQDNKEIALKKRAEKAGAALAKWMDHPSRLFESALCDYTADPAIPELIEEAKEDYANLIRYFEVTSLTRLYSQKITSNRDSWVLTYILSKNAHQAARKVNSATVEILTWFGKIQVCRKNFDLRVLEEVYGIFVPGIEFERRTISSLKSKSLTRTFFPDGDALPPPERIKYWEVLEAPGYRREIHALWLVEHSRPMEKLRNVAESNVAKALLFGLEGVNVLLAAHDWVTKEDSDSRTNLIGAGIDLATIVLDPLNTSSKKFVPEVATKLLPILGCASALIDLHLARKQALEEASNSDYDACAAQIAIAAGSASLAAASGMVATAEISSFLLTAGAAASLSGVLLPVGTILTLAGAITVAGGTAFYLVANDTELELLVKASPFGAFPKWAIDDEQNAPGKAGELSGQLYPWKVHTQHSIFHGASDYRLSINGPFNPHTKVVIHALDLIDAKLRSTRFLQGEVLKPIESRNINVRLEPENPSEMTLSVGSSRVDLQACKLEYSIVSPK